VIPRSIDRYLLRCALAPMGAVLASTMVAFLLERLLRSLQLLAQTDRGFDFLVQLAANLVPHYAGLVLPSGFFIGLFVAINRLNNSSEIDALMAGGVSLRRITAPLVALGLVFMLFSVLLYGFAQPYTRYGYRAVMHAARNAGWSGEVKPLAVLSPHPDLVLTADGADKTGQLLSRVFIRRRTPQGHEDVFTARYAELRRDRGRASVTLELVDGEQYRRPPTGAPQVLTFDLLTVQLPLVPPARLLRARGGEENELTLVELAQQGFGREEPALRRQTLLAELYSRLARALALPFMPLLAVPFALTAKRAGSTPAVAVAGLLIFAFQTSLVFSQGLVAAGRLSAALAQGLPLALFVTACLVTFHLSRNRPGENPVTWLAEQVSDAIAAVVARLRGKRASAA
jgi:lipopolysaccharide export system permease protein